MKKLLLIIAIAFLTPHLVHADYSYVARWEWVVDEEKGERWQAPYGDNVGAIDLRSVPQMSVKGGEGGWGLFTYKEPKDIKGAVEMTDQDALNYAWSSLTTYSDPDGITAPKTLMPDNKSNLSMRIGDAQRTEKFDIKTDPLKDKVLEVIQSEYKQIDSLEVRRKVLGANMIKYGVSDHTIFLPKFALDEGWEKPTTVIKDDFTDTANINLTAHTASGSGGGWAWASVSGNMNIGTSGTNATSTFDTPVYRAESDLSSSDMYVQLDDNGSGSNRFGVVMIRFSSSVNTHYEGGHNGNGSDGVTKVIAGVATSLSSCTSVSGAGTLYFSAVGSTLTYKFNGTTCSTITDTSITGNTRGGIGMGSPRPQRTLDNFEAGDIITSSTNITPEVKLPGRIFLWGRIFTK